MPVYALFQELQQFVRKCVYYTFQNGERNACIRIVPGTTTVCEKMRLLYLSKWREKCLYTHCSRNYNSL